MRETIKIKKDFKNLICPLHRQEYLQLEENILRDGCLDPIILWRGYIVDGHNRYEICTKHGLEFKTVEMEFDSEQEVIAWICANQLGRRNISQETRKFLIGMQYETEKLISPMKNTQGNDQYSTDEDLPVGHKTAQRIAAENRLSPGTVQKYAIYTRALESIGEKEPDLVPKILSGRYKISHKHTLELAKKTREELKKINKRMNRNVSPYFQYSKSRTTVQDETPAPTIKDMPTFDPDAEATELTLTMPSWIGSIKHTQSNADLKIISPAAKSRLIDTLQNLIDTGKEFLTLIEEAE